jgi:three-Cys-motif partner protein
MPRATDQFFNVRSSRSETKTEIVVKYFDAWSKVINGVQQQYSGIAQKLAYIDLYAGKGRYDDGTPSTPLLILEKAIADPVLRNKLVTIFNDGKEEYAEALQANIQGLPNVALLKFPPEVNFQPVNDEITSYYQQRNIIPALLFIDPFGYKGLTLDLINAVLKNWGCDCIFFFNYNRLNPAIRNRKVKAHIDALFGEARADELRNTVGGLTTDKREEVILPAIINALSEKHAQFVIPFRFAKETSESTSHYLIFLTKSPRGYAIMKDIMAKHSSKEIQEVPSFEFNPHADERPLLTMMERPLDKLRQELPQRMAGKRMTVEQVFLSDSSGTNYILRNYQSVLRQLWENNDIQVDRAPKRAGTFAKTITVTFKSA